MKFCSLHGRREDVEYNGIDFVKISKIFTMQDKVFFGYGPIRQIIISELCRTTYFDFIEMAPSVSVNFMSL